MNNAVVKQVRLSNKLGLHARAAAAFAKHAGNYKCDIKICKNGMEVNGKSIMGILMLAMPMGEDFDIWASGDDADEAVKTLTALVDNKFGEEQ